MSFSVYNTRTGETWSWVFTTEDYAKEAIKKGHPQNTDHLVVRQIGVYDDTFTHDNAIRQFEEKNGEHLSKRERTIFKFGYLYGEESGLKVAEKMVHIQEQKPEPPRGNSLDILIDLANLIDQREKVRRELKRVKVNGTPMKIINDLTADLDVLNQTIRDKQNQVTQK